MTRIGMALFDGFALPKIAALIEIFHKANELGAAQHAGRARYDVTLFSSAGGGIESSSSVSVHTDCIDSHKRTSDTHLLFIAGGRGARRAIRDERLLNWLRHTHPFCAIVHPIAEGRLLLQAAELPARYVATPPATAEAFPSHSAALRGGGPTAVSTALRIVEADLGPEVARQVASSIAPQHTQFSASFARSATPQVSEQIMAAARWLEANIHRAVSIDDAARRADMSTRNFLRRFKNELGMSPSSYLLRARLQLSCRMLVESDLPVDKIARRCGIGDGGQMAKLFRKYLETTPTDYRSGKKTIG
jgi:transcriptional regulator GlxA family with amidase domain